MRFNSRELAQSVEQGPFDKEGTLSMKYKPEGRIFKKEETFATRYCKLKGNLLFYYKNKDSQKVDPLGVLVLERCTIELDDEVENAFLIVFEGDEPTYHFATKTERERDDWIQALHISGYECLKMQLQSLREQIQAKTGRDPVSQPPPTETGMAFETQSGNSNEEPAMEICIACKDLPNDSSGMPPNPFIVIYTINPPQQTWVQHSHTEVAENQNSPQFLKTIGFGDSFGIDTNTRIKLIVFHVKERMTGTMSQMGQVIFTVQDVLTAHQMELQLPLQGPDPVDCGTIKVMAWVNDTNVSLHNNPADGLKNDRLQKNIVRRRSKRIDTLCPLYRGIVTRTFRFDTSDGKVKLLVHEYMAESRLSFDIPLQLLKLWIDEEKSMIDQLQNLGQLCSWFDTEQVTSIALCAAIVTDYTEAYNYLTNFIDCGHDTGPGFKASVRKGEKELEFAPVNLHLQRMTVINELNDTTSWYDVVTVGAFTAYTQKYKHGGLAKLLQHQKEYYSADGTLSKSTKLDKACQLINSIYDLNAQIDSYCQELCKIAVSGKLSELKSLMETIMEHVKELVNACDNKLLLGAEESYNAVREEVLYQKTLETSKNTKESTESSTDPSDVDLSTENLSGTNFKKNALYEPWELTRVNTEAACVCLTSLIEGLESVHQSEWLDVISQDVSKLKNSASLLHNRAVSFMTFLNIMENKGHSKLNYTIKYRRDVCFSHAVTSLITGFMTKLTTHITDTQFLAQLCEIGLLVIFEGLLSCHGDENGMIEDMMVATEDLGQVVFKIKCEEEENEGPVLSLQGKLKNGLNADFQRHCLCILVPLKEDAFLRLPEPLQNGKYINVTPVFFNIGINEQASFAERFGDTTLQEKLNFDSYGVLHKYVEKYQSKLGDPDDGKTGLGTVSDLMKKLQYQVMAKKSKNTDVLKRAAELGRKLKSVRFTSCKSAKDRTAMSVTLEQVYILQQEHDLASHVFTQALDCFRSEGVRRENSLKNVGCRKYAFNSLQLLYIPKLYRPPNGTYGNVQG